MPDGLQYPNQIYKTAIPQLSITIMKIQFTLLSMLLLLAFVPQFTAAQSETQDYQLTIDSEMKMKIQGQAQKVDADTKINYYHRRESEKLTAGLNELEVKASQAGNTIIDIGQDKHHFRDGKTITKIEDANDELKQLLKDSFAEPICEFQIDEKGERSDQKVIAKKGAKALIDNGQIENVTFLHPPFFEDKKEWKAPTKFSLGSGNFARGELTYKVKSKKDGMVTVSVLGELEPSGKQGIFEIVNGIYNVSGNQIYDLKAKQWDSAEIKLDIKFELALKDKKFADGKGVMNVTLEATDEVTDAEDPKAKSKAGEKEQSSKAGGVEQNVN